MKSLLPKHTIETLIPQKSPFVMVSHLLSYSEDAIVSGFQLDERNIFIEEGMFIPSGMIENIAQTYALHNGYSYFLRNEIAPVGYIGTIKKVALDGQPKSNDFIQTKVKIIKEFMNVSLIEGEIFLNNQRLMFVEMKTFLAEKENL